MGLKLSYVLEAGLNREDALRVVERLHAYARTVDADEVSPLRSLGDPDSWAGVRCVRWSSPEGREEWVRVSPLEGVYFRIDTDGAESASFGLASYPTHVVFEGRKVATGLDGGWSWSDCCKTQYAGMPESGGPQNFLRAHLAIISVLDEAVRFGLDVDALDDGGYWEHRDPGRLLEELHGWNRMVASLGAMLLRLTEEGFPAPVGPIFDHPDFEQLAAEGPPDEAW